MGIDIKVEWHTALYKKYGKICYRNSCSLLKIRKHLTLYTLYFITYQGAGFPKGCCEMIEGFLTYGIFRDWFYFGFACISITRMNGQACSTVGDKQLFYS
jgi:hypothetical protein